MALDTLNKILSPIKEGNPAPIYFLMGAEAYYIDAIANYIETNVLSEEEKSFNQTIVYGRDTSIDAIIGMAKRYPMMAPHQVVIVKEAQDLSRSIESLVAYAENPQPTTVLVFCYKYKKLDARKKLSKVLAKNGVVFESKPLYDNQIPDWIRRVLSGSGYTISPKAAQMLVEFLGTDLSKIKNELDKLKLVIPKTEKITPQHIEENIGISKDYNNFELQKAIGERDVQKAFGIIQYFAQNPKSHPLPMTVSLLHTFFSKILKYHALTNKSEAPKALGVSPYFIKDYEIASRNYSMKNASKSISVIRTVDLKSKGVDAGSVSQSDLLKELLTGIF